MCEKRLEAMAEAKFPIGHRHECAVAAVTVHEEHLACRSGCDAPTNVIEYGQQSRGREPHGARCPGVFIRLGVGQGGQKPCIAFLAHLVHHGRCDGLGNNEIGVQWQMRSMLFDGTEWHDHDRISPEALAHLGSAQLVESLHRCHGANLANG